MRIHIDIDNDLLKAAMKSGPFRKRKDAIEAGLRLVTRRATYQALLSLEGKLLWDGDSEPTLGGEPEAKRQ